jgi:peptidoglycan/xylan/chitin deacetylase (PgdA/CDA1 family)
VLTPLAASPVPNRPIRRLKLAGLAACVLLLTACAGPGVTTATWQPAPTLSTQEPQPSPSATAPGSSTAKVDPSSPTMTLAQVLAALPSFGPAPEPEPIRLSGGADAPIFFRLPLAAKVAFLTIDDGLDQQSDDLQVMRAAHIPFTMFLIGPVAAHDPSFFKQLESDGGLIEDHTITHPVLRGKPYATQHAEICAARTLLTTTFGAAPTLFRPPFGDYDSTTLRAVHDCGLLAAVHWSETVDSGKVRYQSSLQQIRPGDIILMHFRPAFPRDVLAALLAIHAAGLVPALLENYLSPPVA